jgi:hypothetical protein
LAIAVRLFICLLLSNINIRIPCSSLTPFRLPPGSSGLGLPPASYSV